MRAFNFACSAPRIDLRAYGKFSFEHKSTLTRGGTFKLTFCCYRQAFIERSSFKEEITSRNDLPESIGLIVTVIAVALSRLATERAAGMPQSVLLVR
jgi:hypothetical protein